ncbi:MAG: 2-polyprenyl-3-methyl-5-hydroxy-6-metoxy-1,4-benzoquinol methylase [Bacteriovoracaceae bacterium]|jgi:2-polyprenyl-3-methyl-5-hydroxy-6-metoxy-1,4-benzoquinol methylase
METIYSDEVLRETGELLKTYTSEFQPRNRFEYNVDKEFRLFVQLHFLRKDPLPLDSSPARINSFLKPALGLPLFKIRKTAVSRFFELQKKAKPEDCLLNHDEKEILISWRDLAEEEYKRSREVFNKASTEEIIELETNGVAYYKACHIANPPDEEVGHYDVHLESHKEVAKLLKRIIPHREDGKYRILEYGCGDGRLLWVLRQHFPEAELMATNIFGEWGVVGAVKKDPNTKIISLASVEDQSFDGESFDAVLSTEVIEHLVRPEEMIEGAYKVLKPGGAFIITAPSLHYEFLSNNPMTYVFGFLSVFSEKLLPRFHNLWQPLTDLPIVHYAFSFKGFGLMFKKYFKNTKVLTTRFTHLKKFRCDKIAPKIPFLKRWGGLVLAYGNKDA